MLAWGIVVIPALAFALCFGLLRCGYFHDPKLMNEDVEKW